MLANRITGPGARLCQPLYHHNAIPGSALRSAPARPRPLAPPLPPCPDTHSFRGPPHLGGPGGLTCPGARGSCPHSARSPPSPPPVRPSVSRGSARMHTQARGLLRRCEHARSHAHAVFGQGSCALAQSPRREPVYWDPGVGCRNKRSFVQVYVKVTNSKREQIKPGDTWCVNRLVSEKAAGWGGRESEWANRGCEGTGASGWEPAASGAPGRGLGWGDGCADPHACSRRRGGSGGAGGSGPRALETRRDGIIGFSSPQIPGPKVLAVAWPRGLRRCQHIRIPQLEMGRRCRRSGLSPSGEHTPKGEETELESRTPP